MSSTPVQEYAVLNEVKLKLNISTSDTSQDVQITVATNDSNNYIAEQTAVHATVVVAGNDPSLSSMANNLATAYFNFWISTEKDKEELERWQNRIQQYIMATYGKKSANMLSGEDTFGVTSGFVSSSSSTTTFSSPLTTKGDIFGFNLFDARIPVGADGLILTADSSDGLGVSWQVPGGGLGDVIGPASATDNGIVRYDTTTGKLIQNSGVLIDDSNNVTGVLSIEIGDGTWTISEDGSDELLFTSPTGDGNHGIKVVSDTGEILLQNVSSSNDYTSILSTGFTNASSSTTAIAFSIQSNITTTSDSGTEPIIQLQGNANGGTVGTRPIIGFYNFNTKLLEIESDGTADFQGNTITNVVVESILANGFMHIGDENNLEKNFPTGLEIKEDCRVATTTTNIDLSSATDPNPVDGVTLSTNERILLKNQTDASENGIYNTGVSGTNPTTWNRTTDADTSVEVNNGMFTLITEGTLNANTAFVLSTPDSIILDTTDLTFDEFILTDIVHLNSDQTFTGINTFGGIGDVGKLSIAGTTSGITILDATAVASGTLTLPAATDVLVARDTTDTLTNKIIDADNNTISNLVIGAEVTGASTDLTDSSVIVRTNQLNTYGAGFKQSFVANAASAGLNINTFEPTSPAIGDIWRTSVFLKYRDTTAATQIVVTEALAQTLINKTLTTPTIASFVNATHDHSDGTGGGQLPVSALADGTDGELITWDSSGVAATVPTGTFGQILKSNGAGSAPTFENISSVSVTSGSIFIGDENNLAKEFPIGFETKEDCLAATTQNITLSGSQIIDGVSVVNPNRVLVKDQTDATENGIYVVNAGAWSRATDADTSVEVNTGMLTLVTSGTVNANTVWYLSTFDPITLDTTELDFKEFSLVNVAHLANLTTEIFTLSDLPVPVAGVITIPAGRYVFKNNLDFGTNRIVIPTGVAVTFEIDNTLASAITFTAASNTFITGVDVNFRIDGMIITLDGANGQFFNITGSSSITQFFDAAFLFDGSATGTKTIGSIGGEFFSMSSVELANYIEGLTLTADVYNVANLSLSTDDTTPGTTFNIDNLLAGLFATFSIVGITNAVLFDLDATGVVGQINIQNGTDILDNMDFYAAGGLDQSAVNVAAFNTGTSPNSMIFGGFFVPPDSVAVISATFADIPFGTAVVALNIQERFQLNNTANGEIEYTGNSDADVKLEFTIPIDAGTDNTTASYEVEFVIDEGSIASVAVVLGGTGYVDSEAVTLTGQTSGATNATATVSVTAGVITAINITDGGTKYSAGETLDVVGGSGSGGTGTATLLGFVDIPQSPISLLSIRDNTDAFTSIVSATINVSTGDKIKPQMRRASGTRPAIILNPCRMEVIGIR